MIPPQPANSNSDGNSNQAFEFGLEDSLEMRIADDSSEQNKTSPNGEVVVNVTTVLNNGKVTNAYALEDTSGGDNLIGVGWLKLRTCLQRATVQHQQKLKLLLVLIAGILYNVYLVVAVNHAVVHDSRLDWCNGSGFLIILTAVVYWSFFYYVAKRYFGRFVESKLNPLKPGFRKFFELRVVNAVFLLGIGGALILFLVVDTWDQPQRLISALGVLLLLGLGFLISKHPSRVKWGQVGKAIGLQFIMGLLVLRWDGGRTALNCLSSKAINFLDFASIGSDFVYGYLSSGKPNDELQFSPLFAFKPLSVMFFFGFCISLMYHFGAMQWFICKLGWLLQTVIGTTAAESMNASANIFLGMIESPLLIKPFLGRMTDSEINTIMTSGFATVAGAALAAYITFGVSASYVITATVMASFCALGYSKLIFPETRISHTTLNDISLIETKSEGTFLDAAAAGAMQAVTLIGAVIANIIAILSFVAFLNAVISWFGSLVGHADLSFELILGKFFIPFAWSMGVDAEECESVALLLGLKTVGNEFIAYQRMASVTLSPRSKAIASFALCSFANAGSVGISIGGLSALVPERRLEFGKIVGRAFLGGTIVGFLNGCMAGILISEPGYAEWRSSLPILNNTASFVAVA